MSFFVQYRLMEVGDSPALEDVELEQFSEFPGCLVGAGVPPGMERDEQMIILIEGQMAVHHADEADGTNGFERCGVLLKDLIVSFW